MKFLKLLVDFSFLKCYNLRVEEMKMKIKGRDLRNEMHFEVQKRTRAQIWKDKTKYDRKREKRELNKMEY